MNKKLTSSNSFELNVLDEFMNVMFVARVSYNYTSAFQNAVKPYVTNSVMVEPGTGNAGMNWEYQQTYDVNQAIDYKVFALIMNDGY